MPEYANVMDAVSTGISAVDADKINITNISEKAVQRKIIQFTALRKDMKQAPDNIDDIVTLLALILPVLRIFLAENLFRYLLGIIADHTSIHQSDLAVYAGCCDKTVRKGTREYRDDNFLPTFDRQRRPGGGRKKLSVLHTSLLSCIQDFISNTIYGACTKSLRVYTSATLKSIRDEVQSKLNIHISFTTISSILKELKIIKKKNCKLLCCSKKAMTAEQKKTCDEQFAFIDEMKKKFLADVSIPMISIDCKRKEVLGAFAARGTCYVGKALQIKVFDHDFMIPLDVKSLKDMNDLLNRQEGKAIPFGVYDMKMKHGYVNIGISHDTAEFVTATIEKFIYQILQNYPNAPYIVLFADGGGSNGARFRDYKYQLALLSDRIGKPIYMIHYPPYKSKFNAIERCLFAPISHILEGRPIYHLCELLYLIRSTTTQTGLTVEAELDIGIYETGNKVSDEDFNAINIEYTGPTKDEKVHLSYIISGTKDKRGLRPRPIRKTVFDIKENIDKPREEKKNVSNLQDVKTRKTRSDKGGKHKWKSKSSTSSTDMFAVTPAELNDSQSLSCATV